MTFWTDEKLQQLRDLWPTKLSTNEIGRKMGATGDMICGKAKRIGLPIRDTLQMNQRRDAHLAEKRPAIEKMLRAGESLRQIAFTIGISEEYVRSYRKELGIPSSRDLLAMPKSVAQAAFSFETRKIGPSIFREKLQCNFLKGDEKPWEPCTERAVNGGPYCAAHNALCYTPNSSYRRAA
jgi:hypothetical protein